MSLKKTSVLGTSSLSDVVRAVAPPGGEKSTACVVMGDKAEVTAIITESDIIHQAMRASARGQKLSDVRVSTMEHQVPLSVKLPATYTSEALTAFYREVAIEMGRKGTKHMIVLSSDGKFEGFLDSVTALEQLDKQLDKGAGASVR